VRNEKTYHEKTIAELDASSFQLKGLIEKLEEARQKMKEPAPSFGKFIQARGKLDWPNDGSVVSLFGLQKHPKFNTDIFKKGIEIETSRGEDVKAIYDGSVIFSDWFKGYGMMIILDHGDNYYSVYAHLEKLLVSVGERAGKNHTIGSVGETGLSEGKRLYFEIRHQGEPMDPLSWLQKRG
jgi:septal ring factor EnvC (AmiA/AmiB activator)